MLECRDDGMPPPCLDGHPVAPTQARSLLLCAAIGCTEYGITAKADDPDLPIDTDTGTAPVAPTCADASLTVQGWRASPPFTTQAAPTDAAGVPFTAPSYDDGTWSALSLPDVGGIPAGSDRAYRTDLVVAGSAPSWRMELQSDDGIEVWIDGTPVGQWGGAWQELGCVNDDAHCVEFDIVAPVDVTAALPEGAHTLAVRVSNPIEGSYADVRIRCQETSP